MNDFNTAIKLSSLYAATNRCKRGVRQKVSVTNFYNHRIVKCQRIRDDFLKGTLRLSPYYNFIVTEPKVRLVTATKIRDRVWQQSMIDHGVYRDLTKGNIYDNGACQKDKGTYFTIVRMKKLLRNYYVKHGQEGYAVHLDAKSYFPSTPHSVTKAVADRDIRDKEIRRYIYDLIDSFQDHRDEAEIKKDPFGVRGTDLGSPISQLLQLAVPKEIDHQMKEKRGCKCYIRYNDDVIIIRKTKDELKSDIEFIKSEASKLGINVVDKEGIYPLKRGIKFLRLRFILTPTGKVIVRLPSDKMQSERKTLRGLKRQLDQNKITMKQVEDHYQSWVSTPYKLGAVGAVKAMDKVYTQIFRKRPQYK